MAPVAVAKAAHAALKKTNDGTCYEYNAEWMDRVLAEPQTQTETWWNNTTEPSTLTQEDIRKAMEKLYRECCEGVQEPRETIIFTDEDSYWAIRDEWTKIKI